MALVGGARTPPAILINIRRDEVDLTFVIAITNKPGLHSLVTIAAGAAREYGRSGRGVSVMSVVLLVLGILVTGAGLVTMMIGFGIPINEFSLGHTLIVAGSQALSGGLILIGLSAAVRQLTRIAEAVRPRPVSRPARPAEAVEAAPVVARPVPAAEPPAPVAARPVPPKAPPPRSEAPAREPAATPAAIDVSSSAIERLRSSIVRPEKVIAETEDVPLSPGTPNLPETGPAPEPKVESPARSNAGAVDTLKEARQEPKLDFLFRSKPRTAPAETFDAMWPKRPRNGDAREAANPAEAAPQGTAAVDDSRALAILKSGAVDGMAYTLYADGSIEAQLPHGTVRFGSIAELRAHIENNG